jgi:ABC-type antimicrobial peptide transport system permease subunit
VIILAVVLFSGKTQYASILERKRKIGILKSIAGPTETLPLR